MTAVRSPKWIHSSTRVAQNVAVIEGDDAMPSIVASVRVEIFSDVVCPWCYIGKTRFDAARKDLGAAELTVVYSPFQLDPTAPIGAPTPVLDAYAKKFGSPEKARSIIDHVTTIAAADGLTFSLDNALRANTRVAHRLLLAAERLDDESRQAALYESLFRAYFTEGADIGDPATLAHLARKAGLNEASIASAIETDALDHDLNTRLERAFDLGITAVPTFVIDDKWSIPGAQDKDFFTRTLKRLMEQS